jgi:hypothetical protein
MRHSRLVDVSMLTSYAARSGPGGGVSSGVCVVPPGPRGMPHSAQGVDKESTFSCGAHTGYVWPRVPLGVDGPICPQKYCVFL